AHARLHVSRLKSGIPSVHPLTGSELRALRRLQREQEPSRYLFLSEIAISTTPPMPKRFAKPLGDRPCGLCWLRRQSNRQVGCCSVAASSLEVGRAVEPVVFAARLTGTNAVNFRSVLARRKHGKHWQ